MMMTYMDLLISLIMVAIGEPTRKTIVCLEKKVPMREVSSTSLNLFKPHNLEIMLH